MVEVILSNVVSICQVPRFFTLDEANEIVPVISRITTNSERAIQKLLDDQRYFLLTGAPKNLIIKSDALVGKYLVDWGTKVTKLGAKAFGGGYVGFDSGAGFWSWKNGDDKIKYFHGYLESPLQRREVIHSEQIFKIE